MRPVHQTIFRDPDGTDRGDCLRAALASVLEMDPAEIPHFVQEHEDTNGERDWWHSMQAWLHERGWWLIDAPRHAVLYDCPADQILLASGPSPRDPTKKTKHMVVWEGGIHRHIGRGLIHDPHPDGTGLLGDHESWGFYALVRVNPAAL